MHIDFFFHLRSKRKFFVVFEQTINGRMKCMAFNKRAFGAVANIRMESNSPRLSDGNTPRILYSNVMYYMQNSLAQRYAQACKKSLAFDPIEP